MIEEALWNKVKLSPFKLTTLFLGIFAETNMLLLIETVTLFAKNTATEFCFNISLDAALLVNTGSL